MSSSVAGFKKAPRRKARELTMMAPPVRTYPGEAMTLEEIGQLLGCTRERVRQIELRALEKAAAYLVERGLIVDDVFGDDPVQGMVVHKSRLSE
jgi:hypothetical protein